MDAASLRDGLGQGGAGQQEKLAPGSRPRRAIIALAAAAPVYAAATWQTDYTALVGRNFAFPVVLVEIYIVLLALGSGFRPVDAISRLAPLTRWALTAWLAVMVAGTVTASFPGTATAHAGIMLVHAVFALALWDRFLTSWQGLQTAFLTALALGAAAYAVLVHGLAWSVLNDPDFNWLQFGPGVSNVRQLGFYGLVLVGIGVGLLASGYAPRRDWLHSALLLIGYYMVDWSGGRAAFVAAIAATFIVIALAPTVTRRRTVAFALAAFILALPLSLAVVPHQSWGIWSTFMRAMPDGNGSSYSSDRMEIWVQTVRGILDHPIIGHGLGQFRAQVPAALGLYNHPHNFVLQFLFQWGILGTLALCIASRHLLGSVASCWRTFPPLALPAVGVMGGMTLMALLEGNYFHVYPLMISMACLAVLGSTLRPAALGDEGSCCRRGIGNAPSVDATRCTNENGKPSEKIKLCEIFTKFRDGSGAAALKCLCVHDQRVARTE